MKDEELFKAWKSEQYKDQSTEERFEFVEHLHTFPKHFETTFLAGLKAGRPQWHDLRKDPNDLPKENSKVYLYAKDKEYYMGSLENRAWKYDGGFYASDNFVIAWCEIPTFDKE